MSLIARYEVVCSDILAVLVIIMSYIVTILTSDLYLWQGASWLKYSICWRLYISKERVEEKFTIFDDFIMCSLIVLNGYWQL